MTVVSDAPGPGEAQLRAGHARGVDRYGDLGLDLETFMDDVVSAVHAGRDALGLKTSALQLQAALAKRALGDLYLARACEHGSEAAWGVLVSTFEPRLIALARKEGARGDEPARLAGQILGDLALPPAKADPAKGGARTRLGRYGGMGALWPWLATQAVRRLWREREARTRETPTPDVPAATGTTIPQPAVATEEVVHALDAALTQAWHALKPRPRLCFLLKHRNGLTGRRIGTLLGIGEPAVSRAIASVVQAIRKAAASIPALQAGLDIPHTRRHLVDHLQRRLERLALSEATPSTAAEGGRHG